MPLNLTLDQDGWYDGLTSAGVKFGPNYSEDGFSIRDASVDRTGQLFQLSDPSSILPMSDGPYLAAFEPEITRPGHRFGVESLLVDLRNGSGPILFTGLKANGSQVTFQVATDDQPNAYQLIDLPESFTSGLVEFSFLGQQGFPHLAFDSLVINETIEQLGTEGPDRLDAGPAGDDLLGLGGDDRLIGNSGDDALYGSDGDDRLVGDDGGDLLDGGEGADRMLGGAGDDLYIVDSLADVVRERYDAGLDTVLSSVSCALPAHVENLRLDPGAGEAIGNALDNAITGNDAANLLDGKAGNDVLSGKAGADELQGGVGDDLLIGGAGLDRMKGGTGSDIFRFDLADIRVEHEELGVIVDFERRQGDKIQLQDIGQVFVGTDAFTPFDEYGNVPLGQFRYEQTATGLLIEGDRDGDAVADWSISALGISTIAGNDFILG